MNTSPILVCFAVKEEARSIGRPKEGDGWKVLITGMGKKNAETSFRNALAVTKPGLVITSGFAGGLNPDLKWKTVVFDEDEEAGLSAKLLKCRAVRARFHCADHVATTAAEKQALWKSTGADAVEMESGVIRAICREHKIPAATIRVISDAANEDLPLDFNALMTSDYRLSFARLTGVLIRSPGKISQLMTLQKNTSLAAVQLGLNLAEVLLSR